MYMSETARWDALIDIAQAFSAMDRRGEEERSEEENDEDFIDDRYSSVLIRLDTD